MTYDAYIQNIIYNRGQWNINNDYYEAHHIVPRWKGGQPNTNNFHAIKHDNLIWLYPKEHLIAHLLLIKKYPDDINAKLSVLYMFNIRTSNVNDMMYEDLFNDVDLYEQMRIEAQTAQIERNRFIAQCRTAEQKHKNAMIGGLANKHRLENPTNLADWKLKCREIHAKRSSTAKQEIYEKVSTRRKQYWKEFKNTEQYDEYRLKEKESNRAVSKQWRTEFYNIFEHTPEYYRKFTKLKEANALFKSIRFIPFLEAKQIALDFNRKIEEIV